MPRRRHSTGFGYIGFGNNQDVFNQSTRKAFTEIKDKLNSEAHLHFQVDFLHKKLTKEEKKAIKDKLRKAEKKRFKKTIFFSIIIGSVVAYFIFDLIQTIMDN